MLRNPPRLITACLLLASAAAFATGVALERSAINSESHGAGQHGDRDAGRHPTAISATPAIAAAVSSAEAAESMPGSDELSTSPQPDQSGTATAPIGTAPPLPEASSERLLGINPEATGLVVIAVALSLLLATLIVTVESPLIALSVSATMLAFAALDLREVTHQVNEGRPGLSALAAGVALLHVLAVASAVFVARGFRVVRQGVTLG